MFEILLTWILNCIMIQDFDEFSMCVDRLVYEINQTEDVVLEYNLSLEWAHLEIY